MMNLYSSFNYNNLSSLQQPLYQTQPTTSRVWIGEGACYPSSDSMDFQLVSSSSSSMEGKLLSSPMMDQHTLPMDCQLLVPTPMEYELLPTPMDYEVLSTQLLPIPMDYEVLPVPMDYDLAPTPMDYEAFSPFKLNHHYGFGAHNHTSYPMRL
jgi:hypothetical protein